MAKGPKPEDRRITVAPRQGRIVKADPGGPPPGYIGKAAREAMARQARAEAKRKAEAEGEG